MNSGAGFTPGPNDWRHEYICCEHVAARTDDSTDGVKHSGFRVCCESCWDAGFLHSSDLIDAPSINGLSVRALARARGGAA